MSIQTTTAPSQTSGSLFAVGAGGLAISLGLVLMNLVTEGHGAFGTNANVAWGLPIATYVFFVLTSTGLTFVASLSMVFGVKSFYPIAKRCAWLALATLLAGFAALGLEIGHPFRMVWAFPTGLQFHSPMFWMGVFYTADILFICWKLMKINAGDWDGKDSKFLGTASLVAVSMGSFTLALIFGMMAMRPFWSDGLLPAYFLISGVASGTAAAVLFTYMAHGFDADRMPKEVRSLVDGGLSKLFAIALGATLVLFLSRTITGLWSNQEGLEVFWMLAGSPLFHFELWIGLVLPCAILISPAHRSQGKLQVLAAGLVLVALFIGRYEFVVGGQLVPMFKGQWTPGFASYTPSMTEWMLVVLAVSLVLFLNGIGEKMFKLSDKPRD